VRSQHMPAVTSSFYQVGASLPVDAPSYVKRLADEEFYQKLKAGKFCYVLNSRQMGKSSLRVQTMQRLQASGTVCAAIDLTGIGKHKVTIEQWYGGIVYALVESCQLEDKFDFDWQTWWLKHLAVFDPVMCLRLFIEQVLLDLIKEQIVIFVDEIDRVLSQDFSLDDFFALIRFFQNQRVDNSVFERLTFALLGVATPSNLITDKTQTPFNIGEAIELHGFQLDEAQPLIRGLSNAFSHPQEVMKDILYWTGGQPFLTQKLCQFMVEESSHDNPRSVEQVVKARIIENWESQDEPEHLRTIRDRILRDSARAGYLLELYQLLRGGALAEVTANDTLEQSELQLSGLVVREQNKLRIYNPIYREVFNPTWIETQLRNLRPYSESLRFWIASGKKDESRLLRGRALQDALEWSQDKSLNYQDREFLSASQAKEKEEEIAVREKEAAAREKEAQLERERKDREALESRNKILSEANQQAKKRIRNGTFVLVWTVLGAVISVIMAANKVTEAQNKLQETYTYVAYPKQLRELEGKLSQKNLDEQAIEISERALIDIKDPQLEQVYLHASKALAYQYLEDWESAEESIKQSMNFLKGWEYNKEKELRESFSEFLQTKILALAVEGNLFKSQNKEELAVKSYQESYTTFNILTQNPKSTSLFTKDSPFITTRDIESVHRNLIDLLSEKNTESELIKQVEESLTQHLYAQLEYLLQAKNWEEADRQTDKLMLNVAKREKEEYLDIESINNFSCGDIRRIDELWVSASSNRFGFSVQKEIYLKTGNRLGITPENWNDTDNRNYLEFAKAVGWYDEIASNDDEQQGWKWVRYSELRSRIKDNPKLRGTYPLPWGRYGRWGYLSGDWIGGFEVGVGVPGRWGRGVGYTLISHRCL
jgi:hypothetical protein